MAVALAACGSDGGNSSDAGSEAGTAAETTPAASYPSVAEQRAAMEAFRDVNESRCPFFKDSEGTADVLEGAKLLLCSGRISNEENYGMALLTTDGANAPAGTFQVDFGNHPHPMAFSELYDLFFAITGMTEADQQRFRSDLTRFKLVANNMPGSDFRPLMTTASGATIEIAANRMRPGMLTLLATPPQ
ncbi:MAG: hypothetical protein CMN73_14865 [Sphingomonas sp.]|nr:hypothetical protein [Sphingomonas sp.]